MIKQVLPKTGRKKISNVYVPPLFMVLWFTILNESVNHTVRRAAKEQVNKGLPHINSFTSFSTTPTKKPNPLLHRKNNTIQNLLIQAPFRGFFFTFKCTPSRITHQVLLLGKISSTLILGTIKDTIRLAFRFHDRSIYHRNMIRSNSICGLKKKNPSFWGGNDEVSNMGISALNPHLNAKGVKLNTHNF